MLTHSRLLWGSKIILTAGVSRIYRLLSGEQVRSKKVDRAYGRDGLSDGAGNGTRSVLLRPIGIRLDCSPGRVELRLMAHDREGRHVAG